MLYSYQGMTNRFLTEDEYNDIMKKAMKKAKYECIYRTINQAFQDPISSDILKCVILNQRAVVANDNDISDSDFQKLVLEIAEKSEKEVPKGIDWNDRV